MDARLVGISGPVGGSVFELGGAEVCVGRESSNGLAIEDHAISRRHCLIKPHARGYTVVDLGSRNGTFVNGLPVRERVLASGDQVRIGSAVFQFLIGEAPGSQAPVFEDQPAGRTLLLQREDALYIHPEAVREQAGQPERLARDLKALLKVSAAISSVAGLEALEQRLLESIFEVVPAERGAILLADQGLEEFASALTLDRALQPDPLPLSRTVVDRVLREGVAVLSNDVASGELRAAESLMSAGVSSVIGVPLLFHDQVLGAIYLSTDNPQARFDENHLQLVTGVAGVAAPALETARRMETLERENQRLQAEVYVQHEMVGNSARMREAYQFIAKAAPTGSTVLICGESGTGKELMARAIHRNSARASKPFVAINCAAITETLLESELFGHEKGAFTGAIAQKKGKLEEGNGGTVFLDEIGELAPALQAKLLRVLQEREFERVGGTRPIKVDIRLIAASNRDLAECVKRGAFRQDLYYRLNVVSTTMPPLRERREDIVLLANHFVVKHSRLAKRQVAGLSPGARACLAAYDWPGNVRELENVIERAVVLGATELVLPEDLPDNIAGASQAPASATATPYHEAVREAKRQLVLKTLEQAGGNHQEAARLLGLHPNNLHRLIRELNLKPALKK